MTTKGTTKGFKSEEELAESQKKRNELLKRHDKARHKFYEDNDALLYELNEMNLCGYCRTLLFGLLVEFPLILPAYRIEEFLRHPNYLAIRSCDCMESTSRR